jgi:hypothetical protein
MKNIKRLLRNIQLCKTIIFGNSFYTIIRIDEPNLKNLLIDEEFDIEMLQERMHPYIFIKIAKQIGESYTDVDMICIKGEFEAAAIEFLQKNQLHL